MNKIALLLTMLCGVLAAFQAIGQVNPPVTFKYPDATAPRPGFPSGINVMPQMPQPASLALQVIVGFPNPQMPGTANPFAPSAQTQRNNELVMQDVQRQEQRRMEQEQLLAEIDADMRGNQPVRYELPDFSQEEGADKFHQSFAEISSMLDGKQDLSLKRAVYLAESATYGNLDYEWFCYLIQKEVDFVKTALAAQSLSPENKNAVKWMISRLFSDTIQAGNERHIPFSYDFEDPFAKADYTRMFVTRLLTTRKGQCHSMPLLYLILAEELGVEAYLSYSPQHSYIKLQNAKGAWFNFETTNGHYTNDAWILSSNFIKAEALQNGVFLDTMGKKEVIATCLNDLSNAYVHKYRGYDKFSLNCAEKALEKAPGNINALKIKANYRTNLFGYVVWQLNYPHPSTIHEYPEAYELLRLRDESYDQIDALGYEEMPEEAYSAWLKSFENEKGKQPIEIIRP